MFEFKSIQNSQIKQKRHCLMRDIRNEARSSIKKRARSQIINHLAKEDLSDIIDRSVGNISQQDLTSLIRFANQQHYKAVAFLGNLILDGVVSIGELDRFQLQPGFHHYWLWLIEVLTEKEYCTLNLLEHTIKTISPLRADKEVTHALSILYKITTSNLYNEILLKNDKAILAIFQATQRKDSVSNLAFLLILQIISKSQSDIKEKFEKGYMRVNLVQCLKRGLLNSSNFIKATVTKIIKELAYNALFFKEMTDILMRLMKLQSTTTLKQILIDYWIQFTLQMRQEDLLTVIDMGLIECLGEWRRILEEQEEDKILSQLFVLGREIRQKSQNNGLITKGIQKTLQGYQLLSFRTELQN